MQCIVCWGPQRPGSGGLQPPSAGPAYMSICRNAGGVPGKGKTGTPAL